MRKINQTEEIIQKVFPELSLSTPQLERLDTYVELLNQWNKVYNLTSIREKTDLIYKHVLDGLIPLVYQDQLSLSFEGRGLDLGSGAGVPGLVLSLCDNQLSLLSVDGVQKKIAFQKIVAAKAQIKHFNAVHARFEQLTSHGAYQGPYDFVCARALSLLTDLAHWTRQFVKPGGLLWAWKGQEWPAEWEDLRKAGDFKLIQSLPYDLTQGYGGVLLLLRYSPS